MGVIRITKADEDNTTLIALDNIDIPSGGNFKITVAGTTVLQITADGDILTNGVMGPLP